MSYCDSRFSRERCTACVKDERKGGGHKGVRRGAGAAEGWRIKRRLPTLKRCLHNFFSSHLAGLMRKPSTSWRNGGPCRVTNSRRTRVDSSTTPFSPLALFSRFVSQPLPPSSATSLATLCRTSGKRGEISRQRNSRLLPVAGRMLIRMKNRGFRPRVPVSSPSRSAFCHNFRATAN